MADQVMPLIIYVPGLLPKPEPEKHREALLRCLLTGLRRGRNRGAVNNPGLVDKKPYQGNGAPDKYALVIHSEQVLRFGRAGAVQDPSRRR